MNASFRPLQARTVWLGAAALALLATTPALAQPYGTSVRAGSSVRVWASDPTPLDGSRGDVVSADDDGFLLKLRDRSATVLVPYESVTRYDIKVGTRSYNRRGTILGLLAGAAVGAIAKGDDGRAAGIGHTALYGASIGGLLGTIAKRDRWESVPIDRVRPQASLPRAPLRITLRF